MWRPERDKAPWMRALRPQAYGSTTQGAQSLRPNHAPEYFRAEDLDELYFTKMVHPRSSATTRERGIGEPFTPIANSKLIILDSSEIAAYATLAEIAKLANHRTCQVYHVTPNSTPSHPNLVEH